MNNFIKRLYYGEIDPQARTCPSDSAIGQIAHEVNRMEDSVRACLSEEDRHALDNFCKAYMDLLSVSELDAFSIGFRLGAEMALDTFCVSTPT